MQAWLATLVMRFQLPRWWQSRAEGEVLGAIATESFFLRKATKLRAIANANPYNHRHGCFEGWTGCFAIIVPIARYQGGHLTSSIGEFQ